MNQATGKNLIVIGPGERLEELAAALGGLLARAPGPGARMMALEDLAQLLLLRSSAGRLLLDAERVPAEDVGILRRFLEDRSGWTLHVVAEDGGEPSPLLALPGAELLAWEPDLAALRALAGAPRPAAAPAARPSSTAREPEPKTAVSAPKPARKGGAARVDLSALLDDLIVARALAEGGADYRFEPPNELLVFAGREDVDLVLTGGLALAEACAGATGQVEVRARPDGERALVEVAFPPGELTDGDLPTLLDDGVVDGPRELVAASKNARDAAALAEELGGGMEIDIQNGKLRLAMRLPLAARG